MVEIQYDAERNGATSAAAFIPSNQTMDTFSTPEYSMPQFTMRTIQKRDCGVQGIPDSPPRRKEAITQITLKNEMLWKYLPIDLVYRILLELASIGHKESVLASHIIREHRFQIRQNYYESRDIHYTHLEDFGTSLQTIQESSYAPSTEGVGTQRLSIDFGLSYYLALLEEDIIEIEFKTPREHYGPHTGMRKYMKFKVKKLTMFSFYSWMVWGAPEIPSQLRESVKHLTCIEDGLRGDLAWSTSSEEHKSNDFPNVTTLWIDDFDEVRLPRTLYKMFRFPSIRFVYLAFQYKPDEENGEERLANTLLDFARVNDLSNEGRIAVIIRYNSATVSNHAIEQFKMSLSKELEARNSVKFRFHSRRTEITAMGNNGGQELNSKEGRAMIHAKLDHVWKSEKELRHTGRSRSYFSKPVD